jgi:hypothetical protein
VAEAEQHAHVGVACGLQVCVEVGALGVALERVVGRDVARIADAQGRERLVGEDLRVLLADADQRHCRARGRCEHQHGHEGQDDPHSSTVSSSE